MDNKKEFNVYLQVWDGLSLNKDEIAYLNKKYETYKTILYGVPHTLEKVHKEPSDI